AAETSATPGHWDSYANDPLRGKLARRLGPQLRGFLQERLPEHMVPATFEILAALPRTPNGKIDRDRSPTPRGARLGSRDTFAPPRTPVEAALADTWAQVLGIDQVGVRDNFFELGGHSLLATQILSRVRDTFRVDLPVRVLFESPTVEGLAAAIARGRV